MIKYEANGREYVLRFDMSVMEWMEEKYGSLAEALTKMADGKSQRETTIELFSALANCAAEYQAEKEGKTVIDRVNVDGVLSKHSSIGQLKRVMSAIRETIKDGSKVTLTDSNDDNVRDDYLDEVNAEERKN